MAKNQKIKPFLCSNLPDRSAGDMIEAYYSPGVSGREKLQGTRDFSADDAILRVN